MHTYLRIILEDASESYSPLEEQRLRECIASAPGVERVKEIKKHVRGGYSVTFERSGSADEQLFSFLTSSGYRLVI
jgi:hypothetical protein